MGVMEARQQRRPVKGNNLGARPGQRQDFLGTTHGDNPAFGHGDARRGRIC